VTFSVPEQKGFTGLLSRAFAAHGVENEIIFGGISELQERSIGALTYELTGEDARIDAALAALRAEGVQLAEEEVAA
jgi:D-methionine transport system ATP-binding protein